jgi:UDP-glucose-4-epimerase GalE
VSVLVIGGAGYIGSHAARALRRHGYNVLIYDNLSTGYPELAEGFEMIVGEALDTPKLAAAMKRVDAVMHFAANSLVPESVRNPRKYYHNNVEGSLNVLHTAMDNGVKNIIFSSTCSVYGAPEESPIREETLKLPCNPYGITKLLVENAMEAYEQAYGLRYVALRYFNAAGADESGEIGELHRPETHLIPACLTAILGEREQLEVFGTDYPTPDGTCIRDYIHVNDLAEAHVLALKYLEKGGKSDAMNLATGRGSSVKEVIAAVEEVTGKKVPRKIVPRRSGDPPSLVAHPAKAEKLLGWKAQRSLNDMVKTAWHWMHTGRERLMKTVAAKQCG